MPRLYYYLKQKDKDKYKSEKQDISEIYNTHKGRYGYRCIYSELKAKGYSINYKTVLNLMKSLYLCGKQSKNGKYHSYKGEVGKVADDLLKKNFHAEKPYEKLTTDDTEFKVGDEKVYLSPVPDMFNREIIPYSISTSPNLQQVRDMLNELFEKLPADARPLFHSDQGWQYQHAEYQRLLAEHNIAQSMSRKGNCMDNGIMENFFGRLKVEMYYGEKFEAPRGFIEKLEEYIHYYKNERILLKLKGMSPSSLPSAFANDLIFNFCLNFMIQGRFFLSIHRIICAYGVVFKKFNYYYLSAGSLGRLRFVKTIAESYCSLLLSAKFLI